MLFPSCDICERPMQVLFNVSFFCPICEKEDSKKKPTGKWEEIYFDFQPSGWLYDYIPQNGGGVVPKDATHGWWVIADTREQALAWGIKSMGFNLSVKEPGWPLGDFAVTPFKNVHGLLVFKQKK